MIPPLVALFAWPVVVAILFSRLSLPNAVIWSILGGYLALPEAAGLDLSGFPELDKHTIPALSALIGVLATLSVQRDDGTVLKGWLPKSIAVRTLILLLPIMAICTSLTNTDTLVFKNRILPGLPVYEGLSVCITIALTLIPMILGRRYLAHPEGQTLLLKALVYGGLVYSVLALYEIRMSPQIHRIFYGYFQHSWSQHIRGNGFRPVVFLEHGLWLSLFFSTTCLAALSLFRSEAMRSRMRYLGAACWLFLVLALSKSLGALVITILLAPLLLFFTVRTQVLAATVVACLVVTYPLLRGAGLIPVDAVLAQAEAIDPARASSLNYRLTSEEALLEKTEERPLFGWGRFGRNFVYDDDGGRATVADGRWIIRISQSGWLGYIVEFGLLCGALLLMSLRIGRIGLPPATGGLSIVLAGNLLDLIPNAGLTPITWLIVGALYGRVEFGQRTTPEATETAPAGPQRGAPAYSRFVAGREPQIVGKAPETAQDQRPVLSRFRSDADRDARTRRHASSQGTSPPRHSWKKDA